MPQQINGKIKEERSKKLIELSNKYQKEYNEKYLSQNVDILFEECKDGIYKGHTGNYILAHCKTNKNLENKIIKAKCIGIEQEYIIVTEL